MPDLTLLEWSSEVTAMVGRLRRLHSRAISTTEPLMPELEQMMQRALGPDIVGA